MTNTQILVLMTCHNRRLTTLRCLETLYAQRLPDGVALKIFLVDDGCTDGTGAAVEAAYPNVEVIQGTGDLFWCNGMRLAWDHAAKEDPDFYLWLNDDVQLLDGAIEKLLCCWLSVVEGKFDSCQLSADQVSQRASQSIKSSSHNPDEGRDSSLASLDSPQSSDYPAIAVGSCCDPETGAHTYGGQRRTGKHPAKLMPVAPEDVPVECDTFQGNVVLVPRAVYQRIGNMRPFSHAMGDTDYGLRAIEAGCRVFVAAGFLAECERNPLGNIFEVGLKKSWSVLMRRLPPVDYLRFLREHSGVRWPLYWARPYVKLILQGIWSKVIR